MRIARRILWRRYVVSFLLAVVGAGSMGCNSGGGNDAPQQLAQVKHAAEEGAFRNLGKRSSFDYGDVGAGTAPQN